MRHPLEVFESFANSERYKTNKLAEKLLEEFESFANSERYKTSLQIMFMLNQFESFANSERYKTCALASAFFCCLRALLIQKDTKHISIQYIVEIV